MPPADAAPPAPRAAASDAQATPLPPIGRTLRMVPAVVRRELKQKSGTTPFLIWISFLLSFGISRIWVLAAGSVNDANKANLKFSIGQNIVIYGYHIHHIAIGILLLAIAGWLALHYRGRQIARTSSILYGVGLGFIVDELGFVIGSIQPYRDDVEVFYVAVALTALLLSAAYFPQFWRGVRSDVRGVARLVVRLPSLDKPRRERAPKAVDREMDRALGPAGRDDTPQILAAPAFVVETPPASPVVLPPDPFPQHEPLDREGLFARLLGRVIDLLFLIVFVGVLLGLAKLILQIPQLILGLDVATLMHPILTGVLTLLVGVELLRAMLEYVRSGRIMLPFLVDAGVLLGLRELANELYQRDPDPLLVGVIAATIVALGGLRVFLMRSAWFAEPSRAAPAAK